MIPVQIIGKSMGLTLKLIKSKFKITLNSYHHDRVLYTDDVHRRVASYTVDHKTTSLNHNVLTVVTSDHKNM